MGSSILRYHEAIEAEDKFEKENQMSHFINKCSCGTILSQCRCIGDKKVTVIEKACEKCHVPPITLTYNNIYTRPTWEITKREQCLTLSQDDLKYLYNKIHEILHGED